MENVFKYFDFSKFKKDTSNSFNGNEICFTELNSEHFLIFQNNTLKLMKTTHQYEEDLLPEGYKETKREKILLKGKDKGRILVTIELNKN